MSELTQEDVQKILKIIDEIGERDIHLEIGDLKLHITRGKNVEDPGYASSTPTSNALPPSAPVAQTKSRPEPPAKFNMPPGHVAVRAPTIGIFYRTPSPGARPFVEVGDHVDPDDTVCIFDVMKLFTSLKAGVAGTVSAIPVVSGTQVEQGQPLVVIKPD